MRYFLVPHSSRIPLPVEVTVPRQLINIFSPKLLLSLMVGAISNHNTKGDARASTTNDHSVQVTVQDQKAPGTTKDSHKLIATTRRKARQRTLAVAQIQKTCKRPTKTRENVKLD
jgi:hypothetical protein